MKPIDMMLAYDLLEQAHIAVLGFERRGTATLGNAVLQIRRRETAQLGNAAAVAGLGSALTSFVKKTVQFTRAAADLQPPAMSAAQRLSHDAAAAAAAAMATSTSVVMKVEEMEPAAAACFAAAVPTMFEVLTNMAKALLASSDQTSAGLHGVTAFSNSSSSNSSSSQARASSAFLAVIVVRSAVQIAQVLEAAGPLLLYRSKAANPGFRCALNAAMDEFDSHMAVWIGLGGNAQQQTIKGQWQCWQQCLLTAVQGALGTLKVLEIVPQFRGSITAASAAASSSSSSSNSNSSSGASGGSSSSRRSEQIKWGHLLQLQHSPQLAAVVAKFATKWPNWYTDTSLAIGAPAAVAQTGEMYADAVQLCRVLAAAAPLHGVCNYLGCEKLAGVSEAAAADKTCSRCKCST
jgi:uncharacterized membrane protein YgdD (TMEM256/DUF423 family)